MHLKSHLVKTTGTAVPPMAGPVKVEKMFVSTIRTDSTNGHIIIARNDKLLLKYLQINPRSIFSTSCDFFAIVLMHDPISNILAEIWIQIQVSNILLQSCTSGNTYIYLPFNINRTSYIITNEYSPARSLSNFNQFRLHVSIQNRPPTAITKFPRVLQKNPIYANLVQRKDFAGVDGFLLSNLIEHLNLKLDIFGETGVENVQFGRVFPNGTATGTLALILNHQVHLSANGRFLMDYGTTMVEYTVPYSSDQICAVVPKAEKVPELLILLKSFTLPAWLMIMFIFVICSVIWYLMGTSRNAWWEVYSLLHGIPVKISPLTKQIPFLVSCMGFNIIIIGLVEGTLYRSLTTVSYYNDINTLEELDQSGLPIAPTFFTFTADTSKVMKNLKQRKVRPTRESILDIVAYNRSIAKLERKRDIMWVLKTNFVDDEGEPLLHIVDECFTTFYISFIVPKNSIFLPTFNDVIIKLFESGLTNKWYEDVQFSSFVAKMDDMKVKTETSESISFDEIKAVFYVLLLGLALSLAVFCLEVFLEINWNFNYYRIYGYISVKLPNLYFKK
ncbi:hypothetical protein Zmor_018611 [Zophobas morio]|uniref:Ionotropic receptor n=1 Tax=Zophobas morio TaxID=2755281 RepID=A0AA38ICU5_9CUCU|nr:hypothetical protein Zmor_018611 [Zophobas morio]